MFTQVLPWPRKAAFVRLRFPELADCDGVVHVSGYVDEPREALVLTVCTRGLFSTPLDVVIEKSSDGEMWTQGGADGRG